MKKLKKFLFVTMFVSSALSADVAPTPNEPGQTQLYTFPGIVFQRDNEWVGSDYLYNLQNDIGLVIDVLTPDNEKLGIEPQKITEAVVNAFKTNKLNTRVNPPSGPNALPFFYLQIMVFPTEQGNVTLVTGSLFEPITLTRISTQKEAALQAITWEKKTMFMSPADSFDADLMKTVTDISNIFGERWRLFESMKPKTGNPSANQNLNPIRPGVKVVPKPHPAPANPTPNNATPPSNSQQKPTSSFSGSTFSPPPPSGKFSNN